MLLKQKKLNSATPSPPRTVFNLSNVQHSLCSHTKCSRTNLLPLEQKLISPWPRSNLYRFAVTSCVESTDVSAISRRGANRKRDIERLARFKRLASIDHDSTVLLFLAVATSDDYRLRQTAIALTYRYFTELVNG